MSGLLQVFYLGKSCRSKVTKDLTKLFRSPEVAEQHYIARPVSGSTPQTLASTSIGPSLPGMDTALPQPSIYMYIGEICADRVSYKKKGGGAGREYHLMPPT